MAKHIQVDGKNLQQVRDLVTLALLQRDPERMETVLYYEEGSKSWTRRAKPVIRISFGLNPDRTKYKETLKFLKTLGSVKAVPQDGRSYIELESVNLEALKPPVMTEDQRMKALETVRKVDDLLAPALRYLSENVPLTGDALEAYKKHIEGTAHPVSHIAYFGPAEPPEEVSRMDEMILKRWLRAGSSRNAILFTQWGLSEPIDFQKNLVGLKAYLSQGQDLTHAEEALARSRPVDYLSFKQMGLVISMVGEGLEFCSGEKAKSMQDCPGQVKQLLRNDVPLIRLAVANAIYDHAERSLGAKKG